MKIKQGKAFYFSVGGGDLDGTIDYNDYCLNGFETEEEALDEAKDGTDGHGEKNYVFRCVPVLSVSRGKMRVKRLAGGK